MSSFESLMSVCHCVDRPRIEVGFLAEKPDHLSFIDNNRSVRSAVNGAGKIQRPRIHSCPWHDCYRVSCDYCRDITRLSLLPNFMALPPPGFRALPLPVVQLSLSAVLKCGQSFRWMATPVSDPCPTELKPAVEYRFTLRDRVVCLRQAPESLFYRGLYPNSNDVESAQKDEEIVVWLRDYFQLGVNLSDLYDDWSIRDPVFRRIKDRFSGIRILRQDPWECLMSFICSQNNHISRITKMVQALCKNFSSPILCQTDSDDELVSYYPFPSPSALASPETPTKLRSLGFGYRAEYIQRTAQMLLELQKEESTNSTSNPELYLHGLRSKTTDEAREALLKFVGVGRKVADCVLLMSLDKHDVVPVDTHVYQIGVKHYGLRLRGTGSNTKVTMTPKIYDEVQAKLLTVWGPYAGWAQSVLFTSDLKIFSEFGLEKSDVILQGAGLLTPEPSVSPEKPRKRKSKPESNLEVFTSYGNPDHVDHTNLSKRKRVQVLPVVPSDSSLAERVKQRRRTLIGKQLPSEVEPVSA